MCNSTKDFASFLDETEDPAGEAPAPEAQAEVPAASREGPRGEAAEPGPKMEPHYLWVRVEKGENHPLWSANVEQSKMLVRDDRLAARVTDDGVELGELSPEPLRVINDPASNLLNWADPAVFVRILQ